MDTNAIARDISRMTSALEPRRTPSEKSRGVATALAAILGPFGAHRFYLGRPESGALMLLTLGGVGVWWLYDLILVASGSFRDGEGRLVTRWDREVANTGTPPASEVLNELDALRSEVAELSERLDFAERLLAQPRDAVDAPRPIRPA
ncbi:MAG: TM2 domain-containing protein [Gemmatimonadales bacterium]